MAEALETWREKLAYLQKEAASAANPAQKFELDKQIQECEEQIRKIEIGSKKLENSKTESEEESRLRQFREKVREYLEDHQLSVLEKIWLKQIRKDLKLTEPEAEKIIAEEQDIVKQAQASYEEFLLDCIQAGYYPFDAEIQKELKKFKEVKKLQEWEIQEIEQPILRNAEAEYRLREIKKKSKSFSFEIVKVDRKGEIIKRENRSARYYKEDLGNNISLEMVDIPGGEFWMGTEEEEIERLVKKYEVEYFRWEKPRHKVTVPSFYIGKYPITQAQWKIIAQLPKLERDLNPDPSRFKGENRPVECVSWFDVVEYCKRLSKKTEKEYRLPSEAEWEYATRAGTNTPFYFGETLTTELANYRGNYTYAEEEKGEYREQTTPVGQFPPNAFGLYDLHGNVWEWLLDDWHGTYEGAPSDGSAWIDDDNHYQKCLRGGSWVDGPVSCRSAYRYDGFVSRVGHYSYIGFRVVCGVGRTLSP